MGITYNAGTNTITVIGTPWSLTDIYNADVAGGWGKVTLQGTNQISFACKLHLGDDSTQTNVSDASKQIKFTSGTSGTWQSYIYVASKATLTLGALVNAGNKTTKNGCSILYYDTRGSQYGIQAAGTATSIVNLYGCQIQSLYEVIYIYNIQSGNMYDCYFSDEVYLYTLTMDINNVVVSSGTSADGLINLLGTLNKISVYNTNRYIGILYDAGSPTFKNLYCRNYIIKAIEVAYQSLSAYLVNCDLDTWTFSWGASVDAGFKAYRQYEFDLTTDTSATVTLIDNTNATVFSVTSDAVTGAIATQTISRGYYQQATGDTLQDYGPFTLTITKVGKMPYTQTGIVLTEKTKLLIMLRTQLSGNAVLTDVATGKKFYKDDADTQLTGTYNAPALTGNATPPDVSSGKTFYKDDPNTKLTGTAKSPSILVTLDGHILVRVGKDKPNYISL